MTNRRKSPTPLEGASAHSTGQFPAWRGYATETADHLEKMSDSEETRSMVRELRHYAAIFETWTDERSRPEVDERAPTIAEFMAVRRRAFDLVVRLARPKPAG